MSVAINLSGNIFRNSGYGVKNYELKNIGREI
jgi:hypothetical protein